MERQRRVELIADAKLRLEKHLPGAIFKDIKTTDVGSSNDLIAQLPPCESRFADNRQPQHNCLGKIDHVLRWSPRAGIEPAEAIFDAFERYDEHLYSFYFPKPGARGRARLQSAKEFTHPSAVDGFGNQRDASDTTIDQLRLRARKKFEYLFDFGDSWWHEITVESKGAEPDDGAYPRVVKQRGKAPPQYPDPDEF